MEFNCTIKSIKGKDIVKREKKKVFLYFNLNNINYSTKNNSFDPIKFVVSDFVIKDR
jgi:hypothetical protein